MSVAVMITGALFRAPIQKISKGGKPYVSATLKASTGNEVEFWKALAFGETERVALLERADGEKLTVQGSMKLDAKPGDGEVKIYRTVFVDALLSLKPAARHRKPGECPAKTAGRRSANALHNEGPNDEIPF